jgi:hypothetical protein
VWKTTVGAAKNSNLPFFPRVPTSAFPLDERERARSQRGEEESSCNLVVNSGRPAREGDEGSRGDGSNVPSSHTNGRFLCFAGNSQINNANV